MQQQKNHMITLRAAWVCLPRSFYSFFYFLSVLRELFERFFVVLVSRDSDVVFSLGFGFYSFSCSLGLTFSCDFTFS